MAHSSGCRPLGFLFIVGIFGLLYSLLVSAADVHNGNCNIQQLTGSTVQFGLKRVSDTHGDTVDIVVLDNGRLSSNKLESYENVKYRMFLLLEHKALVVMCKEGKDGSYECGYFIFSKSVLTSMTTSYNDQSWNFIIMKGSDDLLGGLDMDRIFLVYDEKRQHFWLYVSYKWKLKIDLNLKSEAFLVANNIENESEILAGCFDANIQCFYDYKTKRVAQFRNDVDTMMVYDRLRFFVKGPDFLVDTFSALMVCYENRHNYLVLLPYFATEIEENEQVTFITQHNDNFNGLTCPSNEDFEKLDKFKRKYNDDEYDDEGMRRFTFKTHGCPEQGDTLFYVFVVCCIISAILTLLLIAMIIIVIISKRKMKLLGKKLPKKPWETQATEDCTTFMDQTMGVTEATTVGETTGYTTVAQ